jgi:hypothetical protein
VVKDEPRWCPFRPGEADLARIAADVSTIPEIQARAHANHPALAMPDRVAHQYQIAGSQVILEVADSLPASMQGIGLFVPGARHIGVGRVSTGLGTPHAEPNPDFLGLLLAFQARNGSRVDFLAINDPASPANDHHDFVAILEATADAARARVPLAGRWGDRDLVDLAASQTLFGISLVRRLGVRNAMRTLLHLLRQTGITFRSGTAWQQYWTGIVELGGEAGKFTLVPTHADNRWPGFSPGARHFTRDWRDRQRRGDVAFRLWWIGYLDEARTPTRALARGWREEHRVFVGSVVFPCANPAPEVTELWSMLAAEMGGNPGNWIADVGDTIREPSTEFGIARRLAYAASQAGRDALSPDSYASVFVSGLIDEALAVELRRRRASKARAGHVDQAAAAGPWAN